MAPRRPLGVNTASKALRKLAASCGLSPLCKPCGWDKKANIPRPWKQQLPGTPYDATEALRGLQVTLRGDAAPSVVTGPATPMGPGLLQRGRVSTRYECQGAVMVRTPLGIETPVPRSVVRERARLEEPGRQTCNCNGVPWPHRVGSLPACEFSGRGAGPLRELARDAYEVGDDDQADAHERAARALERLQAEMFTAAERRRMQPRSAYQKRVTAAKKDARREGWDV